MRIRGGFIVFAACLSLTGCSLFGKKSAAPNSPNSSTDLPAPQFPSRERPSAEPVSTTPQASGVLAGQILDRLNRRPPSAYIRVVDLEDTREPRAAPIEKQTDEQGYFTISGLRPGGHYQLVARVQDGDRVFTGTLAAMPPNPRLTIWVGEDASGASTSPATPQAVYPGRADGDNRPAASLEPPVKDTVPQPNGQAPSAPPANSGTPPAQGNNTAPAAPDNSRTVRNGFEEGPPKVSVPGPASPSGTVVQPPGTPQPADPPPVVPVQPQSPRSSQAPAEDAPVPSCQLVGRRLVNLALYDEKGNVWEYRKRGQGQGRLGRLVLIDFWSSGCIPCLAAMRHLVELNQLYQPYGLDVVGIAYETGTLDQQVAHVRSVRGRYGVQYPTLLGAGTNCPVRTQFDVQVFPTLILLDENGQIVLRKEGLNDRDFAELKAEINRRLIR